jgi:hypothetical protein
MRESLAVRSSFAIPQEGGAIGFIEEIDAIGGRRGDLVHAIGGRRRSRWPIRGRASRFTAEVS